MKHILLASIFATGIFTALPFDSAEAKTYRCTDQNGNLLITQRKSDCSNMKGTSVAESRDQQRKQRADEAWSNAKVANTEARERRFKNIPDNITFQPN